MGRLGRLERLRARDRRPMDVGPTPGTRRGESRTPPHGAVHEPEVPVTLSLHFENPNTRLPVLQRFTSCDERLL